MFLSCAAIIFRLLPSCENIINVQIKSKESSIENISVYFQYNNKRDFSARYRYSDNIQINSNDYSDLCIIANEAINCIKINNFKIAISGHVGKEYDLNKIKINGKEIDWNSVSKANDIVLTQNGGNDVNLKITGPNPYLLFRNFNKWS